MSHRHPFDRGGLAALSDLETEEWRELFGVLEKEQADFLSQERRFRSAEYKWPRDPLHTWSRVWEYPYVYHHLKKRRRRYSESELPKVVDLGSGVTFFPFAVARLGYDVTCVDIDPVCIVDLGRAREHVNYSPGLVKAQLLNGDDLPFPDSSVDIIYCVSVLEHVQDFGGTIRNMARVLKPGGVLLLTIDLDLRGDAELGIAEYKFLASELAQYFSSSVPDITVHPADILKSDTGPFPVSRSRSMAQMALFHIKQRVLKPLIGRRPVPLDPFHLAIYAALLLRNAGR